MLTPTRELAVQVTEVFQDLCKDAKVTSIYGGVSIEKQSKSLQQWCNFEKHFKINSSSSSF